VQDLEDIKAKLQASWDLFNDCMKATLTIQQLEGPATPAKLITQPAARDFWEKYFQTVISLLHLAISTILFAVSSKHPLIFLSLSPP
jgi:hypothetical protein